MKKLVLILFLLIGSLFTPIQIFAEEEKPNVTSDYIYLYDQTTGQVLWDKGSKEIIYPASLTKMMTALIAIENVDNYDQQVLIDERIMAGLKEAGASRAGFNVGDIVTIRDLIYGTLLPSGAECTQALAYTIAGSVDGYVDMMNQKAQELGMKDTHYVNTTGLHNDNHYSTLYDISLLLDYALQNDFFKEVFTSDTYQAGISKNYPTQGLKMESTSYKYINNPGSNVPYKVTIEGFNGSKSGYTVEARYCLASSATINEMDLILITAHAWVERKIPSHYLDAGTIYNYYRDSYQRQMIFNLNDVIKESEIKYRFLDRNVEWRMDEAILLDVPSDPNELVIEVTIPEVITENIKKGDVVGEVIVMAYGEVIYQKDIISNQNIRQNIILHSLANAVDWIQNNILVSGLIIIVVCGGIILVSRKKH
ncbi:D-alanyl-D-alanine carboxypeptidase family protein [Anaerorhabdus sp.]|uniref:D-alanyl-D-alanine carboxypeptidase family protein n=1 Tax=Anaerorhabdus sp. TaxID=1872524 RepID=UPI002FC91E97